MIRSVCVGHKRDSQHKDPHSREKLGFSLFRRLKTEFVLFRKASLKKTEQVKGLRKVDIKHGGQGRYSRKGDTPAKVKVRGTFLVVRWLRLSPQCRGYVLNSWSGS